MRGSMHAPFGMLLLLGILALLPGKQRENAEQQKHSESSHARPSFTGFPLPSEAMCIGPACFNSAVLTRPRMLVSSHVTSPRCNGTLRVHDDIDGDCHSDLLWTYQQSDGTGPGVSKFAYWLMNGATRVGSAVFALPSTYYYMGTPGDFNGDGRTDVVWLDSPNNTWPLSSVSVRLWLNMGNSFSDEQIGVAPIAWQLVGAGDVNGDGNDDLVWFNRDTCELGFWFMNGAARVGSRTISVTCGYTITAVVVRPSNGLVDLIWSGNELVDNQHLEYVWKNDGSGHFHSTFAGAMPRPYTAIASGSAGDEPALLLSCVYLEGPCPGCTGPGCFNSAAPPLTQGLSLWQPDATAAQFSAQGKAYYGNFYFVAASGNYWNVPSGTEIDVVWQKAVMDCNGNCDVEAYLWRVPVGAGRVQTYSLGVIPEGWEAMP